LTTLSNIVQSGLCIGCGLCESIAGQQHIQIAMTPEGRERPIIQESVAPETMNRIGEVCPGLVIEGMPAAEITEQTTIDPMWGALLRLDRGYAAEPAVRFQGATGGVLTALAIYLLESQKVDFILHIAADPERPMRSKPHLSYTRADVLAGAGSRYGPAAPLRHFLEILEKEQPFAFIGKPCDINAIRNLAKYDSRVDTYCQYLLTLVCGGASELGKSWDILNDFGLSEDELTLFRYRGFGNPGRTRLEAKDGRAFELTYQEMWAEESQWRLQSRCKICPDAIGEGADIAASDVWPGGGPTGEDAGFNGILTRTARGVRLLEAAVEEGALIIDRALTPRDMDGFQPHQVRKKEAVWARLEGLREAGHLAPDVSGLRIEALSQRNSVEANCAEKDGIQQRVQDGRFGEPLSEAG